jgi:hypothetical protein
VKIFNIKCTPGYLMTGVVLMRGAVLATADKSVRARHALIRTVERGLTTTLQPAVPSVDVPNSIALSAQERRST